MIYTRKSISRATAIEYGSLDAQEDICRGYIERHAAEGWKYTGSYCDDGVSGGHTERPALQQLLKGGKQRAFDCVVIYKLDRLARNTRDFLNLLEDFAANGVEVVSVSENFDCSGMMGKMMRNLLMLFAEFERGCIRERCREWAHAAQMRGLFLGALPPFGYKRNRQRLEVDREQADVVQRIYRLYASGWGLGRIASEMNRLKVPKKRVGRARCGPWIGNNVRDILRNPVYKGYIRCGGELFPGQHEALVSESLWQLVANRMEEAGKRMREIFGRNGKKIHYPLQGLVVCGLCGYRMKGICTRRDEGHLRYYACASRVRGGKEACDCSWVNAKVLEDSLYELLQRVPFRMLRKILRGPGGAEPASLSRLPRETLFHRLFERIVFYGDSGMVGLCPRMAADAELQLPVIHRPGGSEPGVQLPGYPKHAQPPGRPMGSRPTLRAITMANALRLEEVLASGCFRSPAAMARALGISRSLIYNRLAMLNQPVETIERLLFETF